MSVMGAAQMVAAGIMHQSDKWQKKSLFLITEKSASKTRQVKGTACAVELKSRRRGKSAFYLVTCADVVPPQDCQTTIFADRFCSRFRQNINKHRIEISPVPEHQGLSFIPLEKKPKFYLSLPNSTDEKQDLNTSDCISYTFTGTLFQTTHWKYSAKEQGHYISIDPEGELDENTARGSPVVSCNDPCVVIGVVNYHSSSNKLSPMFFTETSLPSYETLCKNLLKGGSSNVQSPAGSSKNNILGSVSEISQRLREPSGASQSLRGQVTDQDFGQSIKITEDRPPCDESDSPVQDQDPILNDQRLVCEVVAGNRDFQGKLERKLDPEHYCIKNWEHFACTSVIDASRDIRLKCKLNADHKPTVQLMNLLAVEKGNTELKDFIAILEELERFDVVKDVRNSKYFKATEARTISDILAFDTDLIEKMASKLDHEESRVIKNWEHLGNKFNICPVKLQEIKYKGNPTKDLLEYTYTSMESFTVRSFYELIVNNLPLRGDVKKILEPLMQESGSEQMKDVIPLEGELMRRICVCLNNPSRLMRNWRHLGNALHVPSDILDAFKPNERHSPTRMLFEWIFAAKPELTVGEMYHALKEIKREDIVEIVRETFANT